MDFTVDFSNINITLIIYLIAINIVTFAAFGIDKWKAINGRWRISEARLMSLSAVGGSLGGILGMYFFRHKTKHIKFLIGLPVLLIAHIYILKCLGA